MRYMKKITAFALIGLFVFFFVPQKTFSQNSQLTFKDVMKWEDISGQTISDDGQWMAYSVWPDRGDGEVRVRQVDDGKMYTITLGDDPEITSNGNWVGAELKPKLAKQIKAEQNQPVDGMVLLNTANGNMVKKDSVQSFTFSNDGNWVIIRHYQSKEVEEKKSKNRFLGTTLTLRNLSSGEEHTIPFVNEADFDSTSNYLAYSVVDTGGNSNGLYYRNLESSPSQQQQIISEEDGLFANLSWDNANQRLAFTQAAMDTTFETSDANLQVWSSSQDDVNTLIEASETNKGWALRTNNDLEWTDDGSRLFFGLMARDMVEVDQKDEEEQDSLDIYDREQILSKKGVDVWHYNDPRIKPHQKQTWSQRKERTYQSVYHMNDDRWVQLASDSGVIGTSEQYEIRDDSRSGEIASQLKACPHLQRVVLSGLPFGAEMSPNGQFVVFYQDKDWHLYDVEEDIYRNLTEEIDVPFYNEDHDYPYPTPGYDVAGWTSGDNSVLIYDKYDLWKFGTSEPSAVNITQDGRDREISYRIQEFDDEQEAFRSDEELLVRGYYDHKKYYGFYTVELDQQGAERRLETKHKYNFVAKPENSDRIFYSREKYDVYPNVWVADGITFDDTQRITDLHLNLHEKYNWGTAELIEWQGMDDGQTIRGAVIKPDNYNPEKKYPVLIYYYRFFSQRAYEFNNITNDDRPTLPQWVSDEYVVFLPDIRFEVGTPGFASTKSLVPGVNKLIEMGIADPDKLGLHGHSWSGYQTAFMVTQTDIFDAAIAGAPVSNMTSAYSGIRWGSGLARQFQYEQTQSRIGGSLWEYPERYVENSPVFYADRINTPMLMMFGDEDTAVPWYQGIEMYLAMRRLNKDAIFLQYRGEPHHLQEYGNRLDYAIKMKEYFDHYLRGAPAPKWITDGVPYRGE